MTTPQHWMVPDEPNDRPAPQVYQIWRVDCPCGTVIDYHEDTGSLPLACEECGLPVPDPI